MTRENDQRGPLDSSGQACLGMAYRVAPEVFEHLDHREKNGYLRHQITVELANGDSKQGLIYIADEANQAYLGAASVQAIAKQILESRGPSGENKDYLLDLASSLRDLNVTDDHVFDVESCLLSLLNR
jgi:cation transport regulator ChaC